MSSSMAQTGIKGCWLSFCVQKKTVFSNDTSYSTPASTPASTPILRLSRERMRDYTEVKHKCQHRKYIVKAWCTKYQDTHIRCAPNVIEMSVPIILSIHRLAKIGFIEKRWTKNVVRCSIYSYRAAAHNKSDRSL